MLNIKAIVKTVHGTLELLAICNSTQQATVRSLCKVGHTTHIDFDDIIGDFL